MPDWLKNKILKGHRPNKETMLILFLSGVLIFVILLPTEKENKNNSSYQRKRALTVSEQDTSTNPAASSETDSLLDYKKNLEAELEEFLSGISGIGEAKALIYMRASWEYRVEKDETLDAESKEEKTIYTVNEYGQEVPFVKSSVCPQIEGVAVSVKGTIDDESRVRIVRLIMALYGIEANKVEVIN